MLGLVSASGTLSFQKIPSMDFDYKVIQGLVDGTIEMVPHEDPMNTTLTCYVNECGVLKRMKQNVKGTQMLHELGFDVDPQHVLRGPLVFVSVNVETGEDGPLTDNDYSLLKLFETERK